MSSLSTDEKKLLFDHAMGLTFETQANDAENLISSNEEASRVFDLLHSALSPLDTVQPAQCPDDLAERTISALVVRARESHGQLERLLKDEQRKTVTTVRLHSWRNFGEMGAVAAAIILIASVLIPSLSFARRQYWVQRCQKQLGSIFSGIKAYAGDHDGRLPCANTEPGPVWCRVGYQGEENLSSTRAAWVLVKHRYVRPVDFVCPGRSDGRALQFDVSQTNNYSDFPAKRYITYSPRIRCPKSGNDSLLGSGPILVDSNPIFEKLSHKSPRAFIRQLSEDLLKANSRNHRGRGQNILYGDGSARFSKARSYGSNDDDIFTLQSMSSGSQIKGDETPTCDSDLFFAP